MITAALVVLAVLAACCLFWRYGTAMVLLGLFASAARWNSDLTIDDASANFYDDLDAARKASRRRFLKTLGKWVLILALIAVATWLALQ